MKTRIPLLHLIACSGLAAGVAHGQPTRETPEGVFVTVPERVEIPLSGGAMRVVTREVGPFAVHEIPAALPNDVAVFEIDATGCLRPGVRLRNRRAEAVGFLEVERPTRIYFENGHYRTETWTVESHGGPYPAGYERLLPETQRAPVLYGPLPQPAPRGPAFTLTWALLSRF